MPDTKTGFALQIKRFATKSQAKEPLAGKNAQDKNKCF